MGNRVENMLCWPKTNGPQVISPAKMGLLEVRKELYLGVSNQVQMPPQPQKEKPLQRREEEGCAETVAFHWLSCCRETRDQSSSFLLSPTFMQTPRAHHSGLLTLFCLRFLLLNLFCFLQIQLKCLKQTHDI